MLALLRTREKSLRSRHCVTGDALRGVRFSARVRRRRYEIGSRSRIQGAQ